MQIKPPIYFDKKIVSQYFNMVNANHGMSLTNISRCDIKYITKCDIVSFDISE